MTKKTSYSGTKYACYATYISQAAVVALPPLLFNTFRELYGISYTLLGTLVLVNFCTQLMIDLVFAFFSKHFNIHKTLEAMPLITSAGLLIYALVPTFFPQYAYLGLITGTIIFSVAAGLAEVLISPTIAALPSETPDRDMSALHSLYAYGFVGVVIVSTVFLRVFGGGNWMYLAMFWAIIPVITSVMFMLSPFPDMDMGNDTRGTKSKTGIMGIMLCFLCIFFGGGAESVMTNWISVYIEAALGIPKLLGDILGMSLFATLLGLTRTAYAKYGKNISMVLLVGMAGCVVCYLAVALSLNPVICVVAGVLVGIFSSMLWPGTLILMEEKISGVGVAAYALMAAGGDCGASVAPQLMGIIIDKVSAMPWATELGNVLGVSAEQIGMKAGMLTAALFPIMGTFIIIYIIRYFKVKQK